MGYISTKRLVLFDLYQRRKNKKKTEFLTSTKKLVLHLHPPNLRGRESHRRTKKVFLRIKTIQLVARKVAAVSGDARRCLDICRRAVEISENNVPSKKGSGCVGMKHVDLALKEMFSSPKIIALQCLSDMEVMLMKAVISEFRRTGLEEAIFLEIYDQFKSHCALEDGITPPNMSEAFTICNNLGSCRLLLVEAGNKDVHQRVRLNVNVDDAMFAFKSRGS